MAATTIQHRHLQQHQRILAYCSPMHPALTPLKASSRRLAASRTEPRSDCPGAGTKRLLLHHVSCCRPSMACAQVVEHRGMLHVCGRATNRCSMPGVAVIASRSTPQVGTATAVAAMQSNRH